MKSIIQVALVSGVLGLGAFAVAMPAVAQVGLTLNFGDVAIGYRDGYWDSHHQWHKWRHDDDYRNYSRAHPDRYRDMRHDEDHDRDHGH